MPCKPLDESDFDAGSTPGFQLGSVSLPSLNIPFPDLPLEDLQSLFDSLSMILPPGIMKPNFQPDVLNDIMSGINDLLQKFFPFLMLYKFFLPVLNLILCIIEVLCAIPHPFKLIRALRKLFRNCIPEFISLFPSLALILMIIALLLLLLALIEYIINRIIQIIETILRNIIILSKATQSLNQDSIIAIVKKIGDLLCVLQNIFILFAVFNTIIQIIKAIAGLFFRIPPCDSTDGSDDGCCTPDVCPEFIKNNETIVSSNGTFSYLGSVGIDSGLALPMGFSPIFSYLREETWQFYDSTLAQDQQFINITHAFDLPTGFQDLVFFPPGITYGSSDNYSGVPYYIDFQLTYDPTQFGRTDSLGTRVIKIKRVVVKGTPAAGVFDWNNQLVDPRTGTLNLVGGSISELDDSPILDGSGMAYTINTFFHRDINYTGVVLTSADAVTFTNISYTFTINHPVLVSHNLITIGCVPDVARERDFLSATLGAQFNANGIRLAGIVALLPDVASAQQCISTAITKYRTKVSTDTTNTFKTEILACLNGLRTDTVSALVETVATGYAPYQSTFTVEPTIQFTTDTVKIIVSLKDNSGQSITTNLPADGAAAIALRLSATTSFGELGGFVYDGSQFFIAEIGSADAGNGNVMVSFDGNYIGTITTPDDITVPQSISLTTETFTFVKSQNLGGDGSVRRDDEDISRE